MSNNLKEYDEKLSTKKRSGCLVLIVVVIVIIFLIIIGVVIFNSINNGDKSTNDENTTNNKPSILKASMSDITGNWTEGLLQNTYTFIPSCNIDGLVLRFEIYDDNLKLLNTIDKAIGDVKDGQQYTVTITIDQYWKGSNVKTSVLQGTKTIF